MGTTASYPVNQLMQELFTNPGNVELFRADREALYERYGLSSAQRLTRADLALSPQSVFIRFCRCIISC